MTESDEFADMLRQAFVTWVREENHNISDYHIFRCQMAGEYDLEWTFDHKGKMQHQFRTEKGRTLFMLRWSDV